MPKQIHERAHNHPLIPEGFATTNVSKAMEHAAYNEAGIAMTPIATKEIGGVKVDTLLVSMRPGVGVAVHLHEHGGETQEALTPVRGVFGVPKKNVDGGYELNGDGQVEFEVIENRIYTPDERTSIPEGLVHGFGNPSQYADAHIIFDLPHSHADASDKLLADEEVAALAQPIPEAAYEHYAGQHPLAITGQQLSEVGHLAHSHTPPR